MTLVIMYECVWSLKMDTAKEGGGNLLIKINVIVWLGWFSFAKGAVVFICVM